MRATAAVTTLILTLTLLLPGCSREQQRAEVRQTFLDYRAALLASDGNAAADLVHASTIDYYQRVLDHALDSDVSTVRTLRFIDRFQVLFLRHQLTAEQLRASNGRAIFINGVDRGWIGDQIGQLDAGRVTIKGDTAWLGVTLAGEPTGQSFKFVRVAEGWRLDLMSVMHTAETSMKQAASDSGFSENDFIMEILKRLNGIAPKDSIWQPVGRK